MQIVTTSNLQYDNNDIYDDGRTYDGIYPENGEMENPYMKGSNQAVLIDPTKPGETNPVLVSATTQIHPNNETDNYYPNGPA